ncbi:MAG: hypothetical protein HY741_08505 [Chloroflexi bacterium]|nr:hypothetical protein [Chloroflexota bacterium]
MFPRHRVGYQYFGSIGMYYVHGRWYDPNVGRFISPDEKGECLYGSGEDAVNYAWIVNALVAFGKQGELQNSIVLGAGQFTQDSVIATHNVFYPLAKWGRR